MLSRKAEPLLLRQKRQSFRQEIRLGFHINQKQKIRRKLFQSYKNQQLLIQLQSISVKMSNEVQQTRNEQIQKDSFLSFQLLEQRIIAMVKNICYELVDIAHRSFTCQQKCRQAIHQTIKQIILQIQHIKTKTLKFQFSLLTYQPYLDIIVLTLKEEFMNQHQKPQFIKQTRLLDYMIQYFFGLLNKQKLKEFQHYFQKAQEVKKYLTVIMKYWTSIDSYFDQNFRQKISIIRQYILNQFNQRYKFTEESILETVYSSFTAGDGCGFEDLVISFNKYSNRYPYLINIQNSLLSSLNSPLSAFSGQSFFEDIEILCKDIQTLCVWIKLASFTEVLQSKDQLILKNLFLVINKFIQNSFQLDIKFKKIIKKCCIVFASFLPSIQISLPFIQSIFKQQKQNRFQLQTNKQWSSITQKKNQYTYFQDKQKLIFLMRFSYLSKDVTYFQLKYPLQLLRKSSPNLWFVQNTKIINSYLCILYNLLVNENSDTYTITSIIQDIGIQSLYQLFKSQIVIDLSYLVLRMLTIHPTPSQYRLYKSQLCQLAMKLLTFGFNKIPKVVKTHIVLYLLENNSMTMDELSLFMGQGDQYEQIILMLENKITYTQSDSYSQQSLDNQQSDTQNQVNYENQYSKYSQTEIEI